LVTFSRVSAFVWVLNETKVVISGVVAAVFIVVVGGDVAVVTGSSGRKTRGCGGCRGAVGRLGSECHRSRGAGSCFEAGNEVVVAVVDSVGNIDGGCVGVVSSDVAKVRGVLGCVSRVCIAVSVVLGAVWVLKSTVVATSVWELASMVIVASVWVSTSSRRTALWMSSRAWAAIDRQSPAPCPSVSHFLILPMLHTELKAF
jgi:hypothetical protein